RHTRCYRDWSSDVCSSDLGAEGVLQQLDHLGALGRAYLDDALDHLLVEELGELRALAGHAADDLRRVARVELRIAGIDSLRRKEIGRASCRGRGEWSEGRG